MFHCSLVRNIPMFFLSQSHFEMIVVELSRKCIDVQLNQTHSFDGSRNSNY